MVCRSILIIFFVVIHSSLLFAIEPATATIKEISIQEAEDGNFIRHLFKDKYYIFAEEEAALYLEKYPKGAFRAEVTYIRAQIDVAAERYPAAIEKLDQAMLEDPGSNYVEDALYLKGVIYLQLGADEKSHQNFDSFLKRFPKSKNGSKARYFKGQLLFKEKLWQSAIDQFKRVLEANDLDEQKNLEAKNYLAWAHYFQGNVKESEKLFVELLESNIGVDYKSKISFQMGVDTHKKGDFRKAINWFEYQINKWPHKGLNKESRFWIAESIYMIQQKTPDDIHAREIERAIALYTSDLKLAAPVNIRVSHYHRGWLLLGLEYKSEAEKDFRWLQKNDSGFAKDVDLTIVRGTLFENEKQWVAANDVYMTTLQLLTMTEEKKRLHIKIVRNLYQLKKCSSILAWKPKLDLTFNPEETEELHFYFGKCYYTKKRWRNAKSEFTRISIESKYTKYFFDDYLNTFRKTKDFKGGVKFIEQPYVAGNLAPEAKIISLKIEFYSKAKLWNSVITEMKHLMAIEPDRKKDYLFLINFAQAYDQLVASLNRKNSKAAPIDASTITDYRRQALKYYLYAYNQTPEKQLKIKTSLLDILINRYKGRKEFDKVVYFYQEAIKRTKNGKRKSELSLQLALVHLNNLNKKSEAHNWLVKLHGKANYKSNYNASYLLAELYIDQEKYKAAIEVLTELAAQPIQKTDWFFDTHFRLGELYQAQEKWRQAMMHYTYVADHKGSNKHKKEARQRLFNIKKYLSQSGGDKE
jgi:TolA-binding protein